MTNGAPTATSLTPSNIGVWGPDFNLTVTGTNFNIQSVVYWKGVAKPTSWVSATKLNATIPTSDIQAAGAVPVFVVNPPPGGGKTSNLTFTINPVVPSLATLIPSEVYVGGPQCSLGVSGQNFTSGATVKWNGVSKPTTFVSTTRLNATIPATDLSAPKTVSITVTNPGLSRISNSISLPVLYGVPTITSLSPTGAKAGSSPFTLTVTGTNFTAVSKIQWNGVNKTTTFYSSVKLTASILSADIKNPDLVNVTVFNPAPAGGSLNTTFFSHQCVQTFDKYFSENSDSEQNTRGDDHNEPS